MLTAAKKRYKTDISDEQWQRIEPLLPAQKPGGRHRTVNLREVVNAIFYLSKTGGTWEMLPKDFPPYSTVYYYHRRWQRQGIWQKINQTLREQVRLGVGKNPQSSAAAIDSQSVKTTEKRGRYGATMEAKRSKDASGF
jgi:putative transposase